MGSLHGIDTHMLRIKPVKGDPPEKYSNRNIDIKNNCFILFWEMIQHFLKQVKNTYNRECNLSNSYPE